MKKFFLFFLIIIFLFFGLVGFVLDGQLVSAQEERPLEIIYPEIEGFRPETIKTAIPDYVKYIFNFAIWISGLTALVVLIYAGFIYFTSTGSPEKIKDAKERISYAFFGLIILFCSYLILITINPALINLNIKPLEWRPGFPAGILLCKKTVDVEIGYTLVQNFPHEPDWRKKEIIEELKVIIEDIHKNCYRVGTQENIHSDFDNKVTDVYFIPAIELVGEDEYMRLYGAILYEKEGFKENSQVINKYPEYVGGVFLAEHEPVAISKPSSIKPYVLGSFITADKGWEVTLYEKPGLNKGAPAETREVTHNLPDYFSYQEFNLSWPPQSLDIEGDLIAILLTSDGRSETFFNETDENLLDNDNIVNWVRCQWYSVFKNCAEPAATKLIIISGSIMGD